MTLERALTNRRSNALTVVNPATELVKKFPGNVHVSESERDQTEIEARTSFYFLTSSTTGLLEAGHRFPGETQLVQGFLNHGDMLL